jgi:hypothetical protein
VGSRKVKEEFFSHPSKFGRLKKDFLVPSNFRKEGKR